MYVTLTVTDYGTGISYKDLSKIFELEREEGRLVQRLSLLEELAEEVDQKLSES